MVQKKKPTTQAAPKKKTRAAAKKKSPAPVQKIKGLKTKAITSLSKKKGSSPMLYAYEHVHTQFSPQDSEAWISDFDLYLLGEGTHFKSYDKLGAHLGVKNGVPGVYFSVWAPNAQGVSVIGDFNRWLPGVNTLERLPHSEFWIGFIQGLFLPWKTVEIRRSQSAVLLWRL